MPKSRAATAMADRQMSRGMPPPKVSQGAGVPTAPDNEKINVEHIECPGKCGFARTFTHQTHCCTGCSRGQAHTNNCERILWKGSKDAHEIKIQSIFCECCPVF